MTGSAAHPELEAKIKTMLVDRLRLEISADEIDSETSLFGEPGLGLDSIDALELVLGIERLFDVEIDDEEVGNEALESVRALAGFIAARQQEATAKA